MTGVTTENTVMPGVYCYRKLYLKPILKAKIRKLTLTRTPDPISDS